ncbi:MAG: SDR family NAD(P)-dependent oxidoreductase [Solirubrobacterales bacterium]
MGVLDSRKALITGASSGIGEATALAMAREGASVALGARRKERLDDLVGRIEDEGGTAVAFEADLADEAQARALVDGTNEALGGLDCLVNNAGVMLLGLIQGAETEEWRRMVEVNLLGLLYCTHAALPIMRDGGGGDVVNVASVAGRQANMGSAVYNMTKWGVVGFSEALRQEGLHIGVRVTCVEPGFVATELQGHNTNPMVVDATEKMREQIGEVLEAGDIARAVVYAVGQPKHVSVNEVMVRPTGQSR